MGQLRHLRRGDGEVGLKLSSGFILIGAIPFLVEQCAEPLFGPFDDMSILACEKKGITFELVVDPRGMVGIKDNSDRNIGGTYWADSVATLHHRTSAEPEYRHIRLEESPWGIAPDELVRTNHVFFLVEDTSANADQPFKTGYVILTQYGDGEQEVELRCLSDGGNAETVERFHKLRERHEMSASQPELQSSPFNRNFLAVADANPRP